jgi:FAD synthetase
MSQNAGSHEVVIPWVAAVESICSQETSFGRKVNGAVSMIERSFDLYGLEQCALSFNGGKDSIVVFHLIRAAISRRCAKRNKASGSNEGGVEQQIVSELNRMPILYFEKSGEFPEVLEFIKETAKTYCFEYRNFECGYIEGLQQVVDDGIKGIFMGVRKGDPWTENMQFYAPSSGGWPPFMRINPCLDWEYAEVWHFLRDCNLPFCVMYEQGYTSLGQTHNTFKNPMLKRNDGGYDAAWKLVDGKEERVGREMKASTTADSKTDSKTDTSDADSTQKKEKQATSSSTVQAPEPQRTAAVIISRGVSLAGREALDVGPFLCSILENNQFLVGGLMTFPEAADTSRLVDCIRRCSCEHNLVLVCGGSGALECCCAPLCPAMTDVCLRCADQFCSPLVVKAAANSLGFSCELKEEVMTALCTKYDGQDQKASNEKRYTTNELHELACLPSGDACTLVDTGSVVPTAVVR